GLALVRGEAVRQQEAEAAPERRPGAGDQGEIREANSGFPRGHDLRIDWRYDMVPAYYSISATGMPGRLSSRFHEGASLTSTTAPRTWPPRRRASASLASRSGNG